MAWGQEGIFILCKLPVHVITRNVYNNKITNICICFNFTNLWYWFSANIISVSYFYRQNSCVVNMSRILIGWSMLKTSVLFTKMQIYRYTVTEEIERDDIELVSIYFSENWLFKIVNSKAITLCFKSTWMGWRGWFAWFGLMHNNFRVFYTTVVHHLKVGWYVKMCATNSVVTRSCP